MRPICNTVLIAVLLTAVFGLSAQNLNIAYRSKLVFPERTLNNVGGFAADGKEYALVCAGDALVIVDVSNPDQPEWITEVPCSNSVEVKTYSHYAYTSGDLNDGVTIIDLSGLPGSSLDWHLFEGEGAVADQISGCHTLHIDTISGYLYTYGGAFSNGAVVFDLNDDPYHPVFAGIYDQYGYIHDGFVDHDTLYAAHIYGGIFTIVDMTDKSAPAVLGVQSTPGNFTHSTWLTNDRKTLLTADEVTGGYLSAFDVSDPTDIHLLDKIRVMPLNATPTIHNIHVRGNFSVNSWYSAGVTIVDITHPDNLVEVGRFDVYPSSDQGGYIGCFGVYPYLPSGNLLASVMNNGTGGGELWVLTPDYQPACFLTGLVTDASSGNPLNGVLTKLENGDEGTTLHTGSDGIFRMGQASGGQFNLIVSKSGYWPQSIPVTLSPSLIVDLNVALVPVPTITLNGQVLTADNQPVPQARVAAWAVNGLYFETETDEEGNYLLSGVSEGTYHLVAGAWGFGYEVNSSVQLADDQEINFLIDRKYIDDFFFDYGWEVSGTSPTGIWERCDPVVAADESGLVIVPENDVLAGDIGNLCYTTGNGPTSSLNTVHDGSAILRSPVMDLSAYSQPVFSGKVYFAYGFAANQVFDSLTIYIENGDTEKVLARFGRVFNWQTLNAGMPGDMALSSNMRIRVECNSTTVAPSIGLEATFDHFAVMEGASSQVALPDRNIFVKSSPNPFVSNTRLECVLNNGEHWQLVVRDVLGQKVWQNEVQGPDFSLEIGNDWQPGIYFARLEQAGRVSPALKIVKTK